MTTETTTTQYETIRQGIARVLNAALMMLEPISKRNAWLFGSTVFVLLLFSTLIPQSEQELSQYYVLVTTRLPGLFGCPAWLYFGTLKAALIASIGLLSVLHTKLRYMTYNEEVGRYQFAIPVFGFVWPLMAAGSVSLACHQAFIAVIFGGG